MSNNKRTGAEQAIRFAQAVKGAASTAAHALAGDLLGAVTEAAKAFGPQLIKISTVLLVVLLLLPVIIISSLPQVMYKWSTVADPDLEEIKAYADQLLETYQSIGAERQRQLADLAAGRPISAIEGDPTDVIWLVAIDAVRNQQDVMRMKSDGILELIRQTFAVFTNVDAEGAATVSIRNKSPDEIMDGLGFTESQKNWAELMVTTIKTAQENGSIDPDGPNFSDPFRPGGAPGEAYDDAVVARLLAEGEKYLGFPYVYGGSNPSTSFDCSGFICWIFTQSGVYNLPRTTAQGIYNQCAPVSSADARPGDLIFFQGTYNHYETITHIGLYVGSGQMLHCGNPIQYTSCETAYWQSHFYGYGRLGT